MDNNVFQEATLTLIDEAYEYVTTNEQALKWRPQMDKMNFAHEYQTLAVRSHRRAGYTSLINRLAFDVGSNIGRKYSTIVMAPNHERARYSFNPGEMYFYSENERESILAQLGQEYAAEYNNIIRDKRRNSRTGKVITASSFDHIGFHTRYFLEDQREAILTLTGAEVKKFDLLLIDGAQDIKPQTLDKIYMNFYDDVELFVLLQ